MRGLVLTLLALVCLVAILDSAYGWGDMPMDGGDSNGGKGDGKGEKGDGKEEKGDSKGEKGDSKGEKGDSKGEKGDSKGEKGDSKGEKGDSKGEKGDSKGGKGKGDDKGGKGSKSEDKGDKGGKGDDKGGKGDDKGGKGDDKGGKGGKSDDKGGKGKGDDKGGKGDDKGEKGGKGGDKGGKGGKGDDKGGKGGKGGYKGGKGKGDNKGKGGKGLDISLPFGTCVNGNPFEFYERGCDFGIYSALYCDSVKHTKLSDLDWDKPALWACFEHMWDVEFLNKSPFVPESPCYPKTCEEGTKYKQCRVCHGASSEQECMLSGIDLECGPGEDACKMEVIDDLYFRRCASACECNYGYGNKLPRDCQPNACEIKWGCAMVGCETLAYQFGSRQPDTVQGTPNLSYNEDGSRCRCDGWCNELVYTSGYLPDLNLDCCKDVCEECDTFKPIGTFEWDKTCGVPIR